MNKILSLWIIVMLWLMIPVQVVGFTGAGSGTLSDPFNITSCLELNETRDALGANYSLVNNIDCNIVPFNTSPGFLPISTFTASFVGNDNLISNLFINRSTNNIGLFGVTNGANITDVNLTGANISGNSKVGILIGYAAGSTIIVGNAASGNVSGSSNVGGLVGSAYFGSDVISSSAHGFVFGVGSFEDNIGGLVGITYNADILHSSATSEVRGRNAIGGLVGYAGGLVVNSSATGKVNGTSVNPVAFIGGLVGYAGYANGHVINGSFATGNVYGARRTGGLIGKTVSDVNDSFATGNVFGTNYRTGGLVADAFGAKIINSYARGNVSAVNLAGGLVGITDSSITNGTAFGDVTGTLQVGGIAGSSSSTISGSTSYGNVVGTSLEAGGIAGLISGGGTSITDSKSSGNVTVARRAGGIAGRAFLTTISGSSSSGVIRATGIQGASGGIAGQGSSVTFDNVSSSSTVHGRSEIGGLGGYVYAGTITNSRFTGNVNGTSLSIGGLCGNCYFSKVTQSASGKGFIFGVNRIGGISGTQYFGIINDSYSRSNINTTGTSTGGIIGYNQLTDLKRVFWAGNINTTGANTVGGVAGKLNADSLDDSFSAGKIEFGSATDAGSLIGNAENAPGANNFFDNRTDNPDVCIGGIIGSGPPACTAIQNNESHFKDKTNAPMSSWNFTTIWDQDDSINDGFPFLRALQVPAADSCTYTSGNYVVDCADNCSISSNIVIDSGANITITGTGTYTTAANITNWANLRIAGTDSNNICAVTCTGGCFQN